MKKLLTVLAAVLLVLSLGACSNGGNSGKTEEDLKHIETLKIEFVPSKDADVIITGTKGLDKLIIDNMASKGYTIDAVEVTVGTNYDATVDVLRFGY